MFRRRDEDENDFPGQEVNKNLTDSGFPAAKQAPAQPSAQNAQAAQPQSQPLFGQIPSQVDEFLQPAAQQASVPFIKTNSAANMTNQDNAPAAQQTRAEAPKEQKPAQQQPAAAKPAATNNFVPSALRASSNPASAPAQSTASQLPSFAPKAPVKLDNIGLETERRLTVGYGISLEGKVSNCDKLVIYGTVSADLDNVKALQISDSGCFRGVAEVDLAEISGVFEGELKVRKNIVINATGRVSGKITYGSIEIKPGGKFTGEIVEDKELSEANNAGSSAQASSAAGGAGISLEDLNLFAEPKSENKAA